MSINSIESDRRLFYMNITFLCNNHCIYCISHNTRDRNIKNDDPLTLIKLANRQFRFLQSDTIVLSGGEPTLCSSFNEILDYLGSRIGNIIVYTNGTSYIPYSTWNIRWIISLYGLKRTHYFYTRNVNAFKLISENIANSAGKNIEIKLILNPLISSDEILSLSTEVKSKKLALHLSCLNDPINTFDNRVKFISSMQPALLYIIKNFSKVKISNMPLCSCRSLFNLVTEKPIITDIKFTEYAMISSNGIKKINYDSLHSLTSQCIKCDLRYYCRDTNLSYRVLQIEQNGKKLVGE